MESKRARTWLVAPANLRNLTLTWSGRGGTWPSSLINELVDPIAVKQEILEEQAQDLGQATMSN